MKKALTMIVLLVAVVFLSGCGEGGTIGSTFIGGSEGLRANFLPGSPPDAIIDNKGSSFTVALKLENVGEDGLAVGDGYVQLLGLEPSTYGKSISDFKKNIPDVTGAVKNADGSVRNGGIVTVDFGQLSYQPVSLGNIQQNVWVDICYEYTTKVTVPVCIKKDPQQTLGDKKVCDVEGEKAVQNSGGPIEIATVRQLFAGSGKLSLTIELRHKGSGDAFFDKNSVDTTEGCNNVEGNTKKGLVYIKFGEAIPGVYPSCTGLTGGSGREGYVKLYKDGSGSETGTITCTLDVGSTNTIAEVPLNGELTYAYLQHVETPLTVRHVG